MYHVRKKVDSEEGGGTDRFLKSLFCHCSHRLLGSLDEICDEWEGGREGEREREDRREGGEGGEGGGDMDILSGPDGGRQQNSGVLEIWSVPS